ncbi:MAG: bifunctional hydroxymethylpyrimidine kinase/phosphomethylpyrimidine kinase [Lentisphaerae bacterium]|nr:bifunctional hydroxymethylpyrimidine kinase/phosphomethylpyrimidine kinase [Lentisphaerota bacterium]
MSENLNMQAGLYPTALTVAGSDSGGGAGIQADLKTFEAFGVFGTSAITCITAQSPERVTDIHPVPDKTVFEQIAVVCVDFPVIAIKTGMLYSESIIKAVSVALEEYAPKVPLVLDPVMIASSGAALLCREAVGALKEMLLHRASLITPNIPEAEVLSETRIETPAEARLAAGIISAKYGTSCVVKGGHLPNRKDVINTLFHDGSFAIFSNEKVEIPQSHGTGCTFAAATTACLAKGLSIPDAVKVAGEYVASAIEHASATGRHFPLAFRNGKLQDI